MATRATNAWTTSDGLPDFRYPARGHTRNVTAVIDEGGSSAPVVTYLMHGFVSGAPVTWEVTGSPDSDGSEAPGGPATGVSILAES